MPINVREKLGLGYLKLGLGVAPSGPSEQEKRFPPYMEDVLLVMGLKAAREIIQKGGQAKLYDILEPLKMSIQDLFPIVDYMIGKGYFAKIEDDPRGNYLLKVTDAGVSLASK